ncbi:MAG: SHD1 domain-containing protein [Pirellulaceae bacterium]
MSYSRLAAVAGLLCCVQIGSAREWVDSTGNYRFVGDLLAFSADSVVLKKPNNDLVFVPIAKLSQEDQAYLQSKEALPLADHSASGEQTWTMRNGLTVIGRVVEYGRRDVTIQRRRGKIYVNDQLFSNLPEVKRRIVTRIVAHFENVPLANEQELEAWVTKQKGAPRTYTCEGVVLELENGDEYGVPFFFFSDQDLQVLKPGWEQWLKADAATQESTRAQEAKEREAFLLRTAAAAYQRDRAMNQQIQRMELDLLATAAGATNLWEVQLFPGPGVAGYPRAVVVPGQNSEQAKAVAMQRFPGYVPGLVARVSRNNR